MTNTTASARGSLVEPFDRHYRLPTAGRWYLRGFVLFCFLTVLGVLLDNQSSIPAAVVAVPVYTVLGGCAVWGERLMIRGGLYETADGLTVVNCWGARPFRWHDIARFEPSDSRPTSRVLVVARSGATAPIVGTAQGARITWDGGETKDIVGELNGRLALWRSTTLPMRPLETNPEPT